MNEKAQLISIGELFRQSLRLYRERFWPLVGIIASASVVTVGVILGILLTLESFFSESNTLVVVKLGVVLISLLFFYLISGLALIYAIPKGVGIGSAYGLAIRNLISFGWLNALQFLVVLGGFILLIVPGIIFLVWFILTNYIFAIDREKGLTALLKSREYVSGYWRQVVGRLIAVFLAYLVIGLVVGFLTGFIGETVVNIVNVIFEILTAVFWVLALYVLYQSLKTLKPEVASRPPSGPRGFFYFSAVLGLVGLIVLIVLFFKFAGTDFLSETFEPKVLPTDYGAFGTYQPELNQLELPQ